MKILLKLLQMLCLVAWTAAPGLTQTSIALRTQSKDVDFSNAVSTSPFRTGNSLPALCTVGNAFFQTAAPAGQNLYLCTSTNAWTVVNGSGGGGGGAALPFLVVAAPRLASVINGVPAVYGCNGVNTAAPAGTTTLSPATGTATETLLIGVSCVDSHVKLVAPNNTFSCSVSGLAGCDTVSGSTFGDGVIPLASVVMTSDGAGSFTFGLVTDLRAPLQDNPLTAGMGIVSTKSGSTRTASVDTAVVPLLSAPSDFAELSAPAAPGAGRERVYAKAGAGLCAKDSGGTERCTGGSGGGGGTTTESFDLPAATCNNGSDGRLLWWTTAATAAGACDGTSAVGQLTFNTSGSATGRPHMVVPLGWSGGEVDVYIYGRNASASASTFSFRTQCYSNSSAVSPAFPGSYNAAQSITTSPNGTSGFFLTKLANLTMTGCSAGNILDILVTKTSGGASDLVTGAYLTFVRSL